MKYEDYVLPQETHTKDDFTTTYFYYKGVLIKKRVRGHMEYLAPFNDDENKLIAEVDFDEDSYHKYRDGLDCKRAIIENEFFHEMVKELKIEFYSAADRQKFTDVFQYMRNLTNDSCMYHEHGVMVSYGIGSQLARLFKRVYAYEAA